MAAVTMGTERKGRLDRAGRAVAWDSASRVSGDLGQTSRQERAKMAQATLPVAARKGERRRGLSAWREKSQAATQRARNAVMPR